MPISTSSFALVCYRLGGVQLSGQSSFTSHLWWLQLFWSPPISCSSAQLLCLIFLFLRENDNKCFGCFASAFPSHLSSSFECFDRCKTGTLVNRRLHSRNLLSPGILLRFHCPLFLDKGWRGGVVTIRLRPHKLDCKALLPCRWLPLEVASHELKIPQQWLRGRSWLLSLLSHVHGFSFFLSDSALLNASR